MRYPAQHRRGARGVSLVEVIVGSAILITGLTGITLMMMRGAVNARNGQQTMVATSFATQSLQELEASRFEGLTPTPTLSFDAGTALDGGYYVDGSGRPYQSAYIVVDQTTTWPVYQLRVEVSYTDGAGQRQIQTA